MDKTDKMIKAWKLRDIENSLTTLRGKRIQESYKLYRSCNFKASQALRMARSYHQKKLDKAIKNLRKLDYNLIKQLASIIN